MSDEISTNIWNIVVCSQIIEIQISSIYLKKVNVLKRSDRLRRTQPKRNYLFEVTG